MTRWLRLASVLPSALALTPNDPAHHVKQVAIIGESKSPEDLSQMLTPRRCRCRWLICCVPSCAICRRSRHPYKHHRLRTQRLRRRPHNDCEPMERSDDIRRAGWQHLCTEQSNNGESQGGVQPIYCWSTRSRSANGNA